MFSVNVEVVERLDRCSEQMSLKRTQLAHTALALGLKVMEGLNDSTALMTLLGTEPKAQQPPSSVVKTKKGRAPKAQGLNDRDLVDQLLATREPPSSHQESVSDTLAPSEPVAAAEPSEDVLDAVLAQLSEADLIASGAHPDLRPDGQQWSSNFFEDH